MVEDFSNVMNFSLKVIIFRSSLANPEPKLQRLESNIDVRGWQAPPPSGFRDSPSYNSVVSPTTLVK